MILDYDEKIIRKLYNDSVTKEAKANLEFLFPWLKDFQVDEVVKNFNKNRRHISLPIEIVEKNSDGYGEYITIPLPNCNMDWTEEAFDMAIDIVADLKSLGLIAYILYRDEPGFNYSEYIYIYYNK